MKPKRRTKRLVVEELAEETLVYDQERRVAHCLNRTAARIWNGCDGERDLDALTELVSADEGTPVEELVVRLGLAQLASAGLLEVDPGVEDPKAVTRRSVLSKLALTGAASLLLPLVTTLPVAAQSALGSCISAGKCIPGLTDCMPCHGGDPAQCGSKRCRGGNCVLASSTNCDHTQAPTTAASRNPQFRRR